MKDSSSESVVKLSETKSGSDSDKTTSAASQPVMKRLKYEMCKNWREKGECKYGVKCLFAHGEDELTKRGTTQAEAAKPAEPEAKKEE